MILNNTESRKIYEWSEKYIDDETADIVRGYFTIGALAYLSKILNQTTTEFRLVLGNIINFDQVKNRPLDLLNENITIEEG